MNSRKIADAIFDIAERGVDPEITLRVLRSCISEAQMADVTQCYEELIEASRTHEGSNPAAPSRMAAMPCGKKIEVAIPTRYSVKEITVKCGSTSIYGSMNLCEECEKHTANPPAWQCEDAGEADFE